jgi:hypothetical protein
MKVSFLILLLFITFSIKNYSQTGTITGIVLDSKTSEALVGANVIINEIPNTGAATDEYGKFKISSPVGSFSLKITLIGYQTVVKTDVIVTTGNETKLVIKMLESSVELDQVTVSADYFDRAAMENVLSTVALGPEEIRRSPGSDQDFQRILQAMPGVSFSNDQSNELLVRGGSPDENLTVLDHMEVHSTNHYPNQYNSGGPINMINVDLIQDIQFSTGGFISKYGDKLSSVLNVITREGTREKFLTGNANLSMAGYGTVLEGKINDGKGSWLLSARNSFLDLISGAVGLTAVPRYYDIQFKSVYDFNSIHNLSLSGIYGNDRIDITGKPEVTNIQLAGSSDSIGIYNNNVKYNQYAAGLTLTSKWSDKILSFLTLSTNSYNANILVLNNFTKRNYDVNGNISATNILNSRKIYSQNSRNGETSFNSEFIWNLSKSNELNFGVEEKVIEFKTLEDVDADTVRYDTNNNGVFDTTVVLAGSHLNYNFQFPVYSKSNAFINDRMSLFDDRLTLNIGLRYDYFSYNTKGNLSPRLSASYAITPAVTNINFAFGKYYQTPPLPDFGDRFQSGINRYIESTEADHYVIGIDHIPAEGMKITLEGYYKKYYGIPIQESFVHFYDRTFRSEKFLNAGKQDVYGIDLQIQQKLVKDLYGTISFSRMWSKYFDPRISKEGNYYPSDYDFPYVLTLIAGKRFANLRTNLDGMPFYIKYPSYILPFSDDMEISFRWRYATGRPYTPQQYVTYEQDREGAVKWSEGAWVPTDNINSVRYPDYHRLDIAFSSRFNFTKWNLVIFLSVQNIYNRKNIAYYQYNSDGSVDNVYQFSLLPVAGIELEF